MVGSDEDRGRSRRLCAEDRGWSSIGRVLSGRMIDMLGHAMCGLHSAQGDEVRGFLGLASKPRSMVLSYPVPRKRERSLHTCAQDVQITRMAII
jgi:hypothetical protein